MVQIPMLRPRTVKPARQFGVSLTELQERSLMEDGVPLVLRRMVEHLRKHGERNPNRKENEQINIVLLDETLRHFFCSFCVSPHGRGVYLVLQPWLYCIIVAISKSQYSHKCVNVFFVLLFVFCFGGVCLFSNLTRWLETDLHVWFVTSQLALWLILVRYPANTTAVRMLVNLWLKHWFTALYSYCC